VQPDERESTKEEERREEKRREREREKKILLNACSHDCRILSAVQDLSSVNLW
jgi:K+-sensing histidine kinase KdpD